MLYWERIGEGTACRDSLMRRVEADTTQPHQRKKASPSVLYGHPPI